MSSPPTSAEESDEGKTRSISDLERRAALYALRMGNHYIKTREWGTAGIWLRQAVKIQHDFFEAYFLLGNVYMEQGQLDEAVESYQWAIKLRPDDGSSHHNLGLAYVAKNNWNAALGQYHTLRTLNEVTAGELFDRIVYTFNYQMFGSLFSHMQAG